MENVSIKEGSLLDIGANLGYFCHVFEENGYDCYAVENDPFTVRLMQKLARAENRKFKIISGSVFDSPEIRNTHFNVVLALNIFHHFIKTREGFENLVDLLKNLEMDELFFEAHSPDEQQMVNAYRNYTPEEFVEFILENSSLKKSYLISKGENGRSLYRLS